jgi:predicted RNA-binding Zn ribbon-like protein
MLQSAVDMEPFMELSGSGSAVDRRALLRRCDDPKCTRLFIDRSRGGRRRWCDMKGCGDRAKAAAYRRRHRHTTDEPPLSR